MHHTNCIFYSCQENTLVKSVFLFFHPDMDSICVVTYARETFFRCVPSGTHFLLLEDKTVKRYLADLENDFEKTKKEIQAIEDKMSKAGNESEELKKELSIAYFKLALCEALINRKNEDDMRR